MTKIFWDTNLFIYLFENNVQWSPRVVEFRQRMRGRRDELLTSCLTVGEVLTKPKELGNAILEKAYLNFFSGGSIQLVTFGLEAAKRYGEIRSRERVRPADAVQLACAAAVGTDLFVTNDGRLSNLVIPGVTFISGLDRIPY